MYRNFSLTEKEKKQILEQHGRYGYKKSKEQLSRKKNMVLEGLNTKPQYERIYFNNGGDISIQASSFHYCEPRDDQGPYTEMELGYPSRGTKITNSLLEYAEDRHSGEDFDPYKTVYPYVPVSVIKELINANGGIKSGELPPMSDEEEGDSMMSQNQFNEGDYQDYLDTNYSSDGMDDYHAEKRTEVYANTLFDIGKLLHQIGRKEEAEKYRQEAIQAGRSIWNDDDWDHYD